MKTRGKIRKIFKKDGQTQDGRIWSRYSIQLEDGKYYSTFNVGFADKLKEGQEVEFDYEERQVEKDGRTYINRNIVFPKNNGSNNPQIVQILIEIRDLLKRIYEKKEISGEIMEDREPPEVDKEPEDDEINPEEIPF